MMVVMKAISVLVVFVGVGLVVLGCAPSRESAERDVPTVGATAVVGAEVGADLGSPWALPLDQRPPLFDPCTEIPESALREVGLSAGDYDRSVPRNQLAVVKACSWGNAEFSLEVLASWKARHELENWPSLSFVGTEMVSGRQGVFAYNSYDVGKDARMIRSFFFTMRGTISLSVGLKSPLRVYKGNNFTKVKQVYDNVAPCIVAFLPEGDF